MLRGFRPGEVVHVALANVGAGEGVASGTAVLSLPTEFLDEGTVHVDADLGDSDSDSESESAGDGLEAPEVDVDPAAAACACRGGAASGPGAAVLGMMGVLGALGLLRRRRRGT